MKKFMLFCCVSFLVACGNSEPTYDPLTTSQLDKISEYEGKDVNFVSRQSNSRHGNWKYVNSVSETTFEVDSYMFTRSVKGVNRFGNRLVLGVACSKNSWSKVPEFSVYVRADQVVTSLVAYRFDGEKPNNRARANVWEGMDGVSLYSAQSFIKQALTKNYVMIELNMYSESNIEAKFMLKGFSKAFEKVYRDCWIAANS